MFTNICFTLNNYTEEEIRHISSQNFKYLIFGKEIGEEGTPHLQGYAELESRSRFNKVKLMLGERAHFERRMGTQEQAINYCKKDGDWVEFGIKNNQGARHDLDTFRRLALDEGMRAVTSIGNIQQIKVAEKFLSYNETERDWKPEVIWLWGPTGTGKSRRARELCNDDTYTKNTGTKWWDGYDGHENVIIDDFRDEWWDMTYMLGLLDRYPFKVEYKGGSRQMRARKIVITSAFSPETCYRGRGEAIEQLLRRIDRVINLVQDVQEVEGVIL